MNYTEAKQIIESITYKPGWEIDFKTDADGSTYVQLQNYVGVDSTTGVVSPWKSGKRYLSPHMCRQEIVGLVFDLIKSAEMHEVHEWFRYRGASIYNPHLDPDVLVEVARKKESFNVRKNAMTMQEDEK